MKLAILIPVMLLFTSLAYAQEFTWIDGEENSYNMNPDMVSYVVCNTLDGKTWFSGMKEKNIQSLEMMGDVFLISYNDSGDRIDEFLITGNATVKAIEKGAAGELFLGGEFYQDDLVFWDNSVLSWQGTYHNPFVIKIMPDGTIDWTVNLHEFLEPNSSISSMKYTGDSLLITHWNWQNSFVSSISPTGDVNTMIVQTRVNSATGVDIDPEGNIYVTGSCASSQSSFNGEPFPSPFPYSKYLVKYSPQGFPEWVEYSEDITCISPRVKVGLDGHIYWAGRLHTPCTFDTIDMEGAEWVNDFYLVRYTPGGSAEWAIEVPQVTSGDATVSKFESITVLPDNTVSFIGTIRGQIDWGNGIVTGNLNSLQQILIMNFSIDGEILWAKTGGGPNYQASQSCYSDSEGDIHITGVSHDTAYFDNLSFHLESFYYPFVTELESGVLTHILAEKRNTEMVVSPNPVTDYFTVPLRPEEIEEVSIIDLMGNVVIHSISKQNTVSVKALKPSLYIVKLRMGDGTVYHSKILKQ